MRHSIGQLIQFLQQTQGPKVGKEERRRNEGGREKKWERKCVDFKRLKILKAVTI